MRSFSTTLVSLLVAAVSVTSCIADDDSENTNSTSTYSNEWHSPYTLSATTRTTAGTIDAGTTTATKTISISVVGGATPTALTTTFPASAGTTIYPTAIVVSGSFDGKMMKFDRDHRVCAEQVEKGKAEAIFILNDGATLSNVIIGSNQAEGVHCRGNCVLNNVWWLNVCEDAATFQAPSGTSYINGGGAINAADKVFQHNGFGKVSIKNFYVDTYGKLYRSCGNCRRNGKARAVIMDNIYAKNGDVLIGINTNYGDTAKISNSCVSNNRVCDLFKGTVRGEPRKLSSGPDKVHCVANNIKTSC
ncbi:pectate lyase-domain-containing protein [Tirmania nivea]|nr:pectate lyase-domain-containing protein [Tirmania nivea]